MTLPDLSTAISLRTTPTSGFEGLVECDGNRILKNKAINQRSATCAATGHFPGRSGGDLVDILVEFVESRSKVCAACLVSCCTWDSLARNALFASSPGLKLPHCSYRITIRWLKGG